MSTNNSGSSPDHEQDGGSPQKPSGPLLDRQDLLQLFHISVRTLQKWRSKGILPYIRIRGKIYYRQHDIDEMLQNHRHQKPGK